MQSACFCRSGSTLKPCLRTVTPCGRAVGRDAELGHPGQERVLVAVEPDAQGLAAEVLGLGDAGVLAAGQHHARALERLGDVDQRHALLAAGQGRGHPVDDDVGTPAGDHLRRGDVGSAGVDGDVEPGLLVEALVLGDIVAGELRLGDPFQLQGHRVGGVGRADAQRQDRRRECRPLHLFSSSSLVDHDRR